MQQFSFLTTKDNWSGESAMIKGEVFAGVPTWEQNGYKIELREYRHFDDDFGFQMYTVYIDGRCSRYKVGKDDSSDMWECRDDAEDMYRQASDLGASGFGAVAATAKVLFNTL
jgi:hypothetical protein